MNSVSYAGRKTWLSMPGLVITALVVTSLLLLSGVVRAGHTDACNSTEVGNTTCGGYNMQMIKTCANDSGVYDWNDTYEFCDFGCINGTCVSFTKPCIDYCTYNQTRCNGDYLIYCNDTDSDGCNDWTILNREFCEYGCLSGQCITGLSYCAYGDEKCESGIIHNCSLGDDGFYAWSPDVYCEYGCDYVYSGGVISDIACAEVGDAHDVASSINQGVNQARFAFEPIIIIAYIILSLAICGVASSFIGNAAIGVWGFMLMIVLGGFFGVIPFYISFIMVILGFAWVYKGFRGD